MRVAVLSAAVAAALSMVVSSMAQNQPSLASAAEPATVEIKPVISDAVGSGFLTVDTDRVAEDAAAPIAGDVRIRLKSQPADAGVSVGKFMSLAGEDRRQSYAFDLKSVPQLDAQFLDKVAAGDAVIDVKVSVGRPEADPTDSQLSIVTSTFSR